MKTGIEKKVLIDAHELVMMKAAEAQMKLNMQNMADQLDNAQEELKVTKGELSVVTKDLRDTRQLLHAAVGLQEKAEATAERCERVLTGFLSQWLSRENMERVRAMLRFYHPLERVKMIGALLTYLIFGKKVKLDREVERTHFVIICDKIDEDSILLPAHSLMVQLMQKYGLNKELRDIALND